MPEGKKNTVPAPVRDEDGYSAKTHLHQPVQETATVAATALLADAPEGALPTSSPTPPSPCSPAVWRSSTRLWQTAP